MSEIQTARMTPSGKEYTGEKIKLGKEALQNTISAVEKMDASTVAKELNQYKDIIPGKDNKNNTFEMMALYQRALGLLWYETKVDARFGGDTYTKLKTVQAEKLKFTGNDIDGFPGPKTTKALIELLWKPQNVVVTAPAPIVQKRAPAASETVAPVTPVAPVVANSPVLIVRPQANPVAALDTKIDFSVEQKRASEIMELAKKPSMIQRMNGNGNFYNGSAPLLIEYALIKQGDGELYVFDKPNQGSRTVFRLNSKNEVIGSTQVNSDGTSTSPKWAPMKNISYMPTPTIVAK